MITKNVDYFATITWARGSRLIDIPKPKGCKPKGAGIAICHVNPECVVANSYIHIMLTKTIYMVHRANIFQGIVQK